MRSGGPATLRVRFQLASGGLKNPGRAAIMTATRKRAMMKSLDAAKSLCSLEEVVAGRRQRMTQHVQGEQSLAARRGGQTRR